MHDDFSEQDLENSGNNWENKIKKLSFLAH